MLYLYCTFVDLFLVWFFFFPLQLRGTAFDSRCYILGVLEDVNNKFKKCFATAVKCFIGWKQVNKRTQKMFYFQ